MTKHKIIVVKGIEITISKQGTEDFISLTDMLKVRTEISLFQIG